MERRILRRAFRVNLSRVALKSALVEMNTRRTITPIMDDDKYRKSTAVHSWRLLLWHAVAQRVTTTNAHYKHQQQTIWLLAMPLCAHARLFFFTIYMHVSDHASTNVSRKYKCDDGHPVKANSWFYSAIICYWQIIVPVYLYLYMCA